MNSFFEKLASGSLPERDSTEQVRLLGKRAARAYIEKEAKNLTDAVHSVVEDMDLNRDQIRRVAETANQETWNELFHRGGDKSTTFDPADAAQVIGQLTSRPEPIAGDPNLDFLSDVPNQTSDVDWSDVFKVKADTPEYEALNPLREAEEMNVKTASALDTARYGVDLLAHQLAEAGEEFYQMVKQAHLTDDVGILQIAKAVGEAVQDPTFGVSVMEQVTARLQSDGVRFREAVELQKVAKALVVNHEHPLLKQAAVLEQLAHAYYGADQQMSELQETHTKTAAALRQKARKR